MLLFFLGGGGIGGGREGCPSPKRFCTFYSDRMIPKKKVNDLVTLLHNQKVPTNKYRVEEEKDRAAVMQSEK